MDKIIVNSSAKINLSLDVTGKRDDGYHNVKMIMQQCGLCDAVTLEKTSENIALKTNLGFLPVDSKNIAYKAAMKFFEYTGINGGVNIEIAKRIPVCAGLAGGSGNGAAVINGLDVLYETNLSEDEKCHIGVQVGADVPYCICGGTMLAEGIGEKLSRLPQLKRTPVVIVKPNINVSTPTIYSALDNEPIEKHPDTNLLISALENGNIEMLAKNMYNVMENVTAKMFPVISDIKQKLLDGGALGTVMSGSGPSVFALFDDYKKAHSAVKKLRGKHFVYVGWTKML